MAELFSPEFRGVFVLSRGLELTFVGGQRRMKCHEAAAADNVTGRRSGGPPRPEGISSPAAAFLRSLEPSVSFDKRF